MMQNLDLASFGASAIAIIGMAGRFPEATNLESFWQNMREGRESILALSEEEMRAAGVPDSLLQDPRYVRAAATIDDIEMFDAHFFGMSAREANLTDPQQRIFLEVAAQALEEAGISPEQFKGWIGVYAAAAKNSYLVNQLVANGSENAPADAQLIYGNEKDYIATRLSYKLNLRGPSISVQTACSSSLVAVSLACQALLTYQCDAAVVGGANVQVPHKAGYIFEEGAYASPDGHCRAFDAEAKGTVFANGGVGVVVLRRLEDAWAEGDNIRAIIRGTAINNDGADKVGYTAPSVDGQAAVIALAQKIAEISPDTIAYVEGHGTGTALGDPIEVAALTRAFRKGTKRNGFCGLGSVKANIGHAGAAAGVAGLIKTVLAMEHEEVPPTLHFSHPNPQIDFAASPFYVNDSLRKWPRGKQPRRAGVSSFGIGGTNAHLVLEEAPVRGGARPVHRSRQLLPLSAKTDTALETMARNLSRHLRTHPEQDLADVAHTLQTGRRRFPYRRFVVCENRAEAAAALDQIQANSPREPQEAVDRPVVFLFPGGGSQYVSMAAGLYAEEPVFRESMDECARLLTPRTGVDIRQKIYPAAEVEAAREQMQQSRLGLPALFAVSYSLARLWMSWGIEPKAMMGHSLGEYVAACLSGVLSLEDALTLVALRGELFDRLPAGAMLTVSLPLEKISPYLGAELTIAAINGPQTCVVSGPLESIDRIAGQLAAEQVETKRVPLATAAHSRLVEPALHEFQNAVARIKRNAPKIPYISNVTGDWITTEQCQSAQYWADHLRQTVRFHAGLQTLLSKYSLFLEVGPGHTLSSLARQATAKSEGQAHAVFSSLRHPHDTQHDMAFLAANLGGLWTQGCTVDWKKYQHLRLGRRLSLPTYPFERERYWYDSSPRTSKVQNAGDERASIMNFLHVPYWKPELAQAGKVQARPGKWLVFADAVLAPGFISALRAEGRRVFLVEPGPEFRDCGEGRFVMPPDSPEGYRALVAAVRELGEFPANIAYFWALSDSDCSHDSRNGQLNRNFYSLIYLVQAIGSEGINSNLKLLAVSRDAYPVLLNEAVSPEAAAILGPMRVIPQEHANIKCLHADLAGTELRTGDPRRVALQLRNEFERQRPDVSVALRNGRIWKQAFDPIPLPEPPAGASRLRQHGVYLITGGLGRIGLALARKLARAASARLVLVSRSGIHDPKTRQQWAASGKSVSARRTEIAAAGSQSDERASASNPRNALEEKEALEQLEKLGAQVLVAQADAGSLSDMQSVLEQVRARFGEVNGVIHAAMIPGGGMIQMRAAAVAKAEFWPKLQGALVLRELFHEKPLDFMVLCSSLVGLRGYIGQAGYCAASSFLDAFAHQQALEHPDRLVVSVDWGLWDMRGISIPFTQKQQALAVRDTRLGITEEEGAEVFARILSCQYLPQVIVSPYAVSRVGAPPEEEQRFGSAPAQQASRTRDSKGHLHGRPPLQNAYVAPENDLQKKLVEIWENVLGVSPIGVDDRFTELGGDSLMGVRVIAKSRESCQITLTIRMLFEHSTIRRLAERVEGEQRGAQPALSTVVSVPNDEWKEGEI